MTDSRRAQAAPPTSARPLGVCAALICAAIGGFLAFLAFPGYNQWYLMPISVAFLSAASHVRSRFLTAICGLVWGLSFFIPLLSWTGVYVGVEPWLALAAVESLFMMVLALLMRPVLLRRTPGWVSAMTVGGLWTACEFARSSVPFGGFPWGTTAFSQADSPLLAFAPWIGMGGFAFLVGGAGHLLYVGAISLLKRRGEGFNGLYGLWAWAVCAVIVVVSIVTPMPRDVAPHNRSTVTVAGIQGNTTSSGLRMGERPGEILDNHASLTEKYAEELKDRGKTVDFMVWPENASDLQPARNLYARNRIQEAVDAAGVPVFVGAQKYTADDQHRFNTLQLWEPDKGMVNSYSKQHPVPFGEYIPFRSFFRSLSSKVDLVPVDMLPGTSVGVMDVAGTKAGLLICFEIAYESLVQDTVKSGAQILLVPTNTALFGTTDESVQQLAESQVMAAISGRSVVHISTVGISAMITPDGRIISSSGHWTPEVLESTLPLRTGITPAIAAGPWIYIGASALGLAGLAGALSRPNPYRRAARKTASSPQPPRKDNRSRKTGTSHKHNGQRRMKTIIASDSREDSR
ncbi:apolipoprotein N-acyltransferase [Devriesea agamarum]|uniref:apolipoprotein N-acyltransferase n=1 Tax=Devriesea agamarum TaxID=472569 RepID=UPI00071E365D|nr:apolipoprotein N-acyltransferase [Devriesea agamarum]